MNREELVAKTQLTGPKVNEVLTAAQLPPDAQDYTPEQIKVVEELIRLVENKQAKTYKEAGEIYRKPLNEAKLNEIALRYLMVERIPEILLALKFKTETLGEGHFAVFLDVCQQLQQGLDLAMVAPAALSKAKESKAQKSAATPAAKSGQTPATAPAVTAAQVNGKASAQTNGQGTTTPVANSAISLHQDNGLNGSQSGGNEVVTQFHQQHASGFVEIVDEVIAPEPVARFNEAAVDSILAEGEDFDPQRAGTAFGRAVFLQRVNELFNSPEAAEQVKEAVRLGKLRVQQMRAKQQSG